MNGGWSLRKISVAIYPFMAAAMAINLFMLSLIWGCFGIPALTPYQALTGGALLGVPVSYAFARQIRKLIDQSDRPL